MTFDIQYVPSFGKDLKKLSKKYPSLKNDFAELVRSLEKEPFQGVALGNSCRKIRLKISSKGKGKSGGARVITYVVIKETIVYLLAIYDKSDRLTLSDKDISKLLKRIDSN